MSWIELIAERKIQDAQERREFANLGGAGQPLDVSFDPNTPAELRAVHHLLRRAQWTPEWIDLEREIERHEARQVALEQGYARRRAAALARLGTLADLTALAELDRARDRFLLRAVEQLRELDALIQRFNLIVPALSRQRRRPAIGARLRQLAASYPRLRPLPPGEPEPWEAAVAETEPRPLRMTNRLPRRRVLTPG